MFLGCGPPPSSKPVVQYCCFSLDPATPQPLSQTLPLCPPLIRTLVLASCLAGRAWQILCPQLQGSRERTWGHRGDVWDSGQGGKSGKRSTTPPAPLLHPWQVLLQ